VAFTPGEWIADFHNEKRDGGRFITYIRGGNQLVPIAAVPTGVEGYGREEGRANARLIAAAPDLYEALADLAEVFALPGENSIDRFERLAAWFRKDTGYLAPGKDQPMCGPDQPDGDELRAIYDAWYQAKIDRARAALSRAGKSS
jgi:hypothetical protein